MRVVVRQISTGLYWNRETGWGDAANAAAFPNSGEAIVYCLEKQMRDVHVVLDFGDPKFDVVLRPFGESGTELTSEELLERGREVTQTSKEMTQQTKDALAAARQTVAALKERKKRVPFKRKPVADDQGEGV